MDTESLNSTVTAASFSTGSAADPPLQADASPALCALVGKAKASSNTMADRQLEDRLTHGRLGVASSLFRSLRLKHPPTAKHCLRVSLGCSAFASFLKLDDATREQIEIAALLHDIGKIGVPDHILNKPGRLDSDEVSLMERNRSFGVHILEACCDNQEILNIIQFASTWFDGTRPTGCQLQGQEIPLGARIVAIQDAFDSMTTDMVYRQALPRDRAIGELFESAATQFDPTLVAAFAEVNNGQHQHLNGEVVRRWVEMVSDDADMIWSFGSPLTSVTGDAQTIFQQQLLDAMQDGVAFVDLSGRILVWSPGAERLTGLSTEGVQHKAWQPKLIDLRDPEGNAIKPHTCPLNQSLRNLSHSKQRMSITHREDKRRVAVLVHVIPVKDSTGTCHGATMLLHDISSERNLEERVQNLHTKATTDQLTGVGNRAEFDRRHQEFVAKHAESGEPFSLIICDIDKFKAINDTYGHQAGDDALVEFAALINRHRRGNDLVARYGGEEFVVLCPGCNNDEGTRKAEQIRRELAKTPQPSLNGKCMTASFGVTELQPGDTPETMLKRADRGLYQAKDTGRNRVVQIGTGGGDSRDERPKRSSWFSWGKAEDDCLLDVKLHSSVPLNVVAEKIRGFIADNDAEVLDVKENFVSLSVDDSLLPANQRRQSDRPVCMSIDIGLKAASDVDPKESGTFIQVKISSKRTRDRRRDDVTARADQLLTSLRSYLMAEEV